MLHGGRRAEDGLAAGAQGRVRRREVSLFGRLKRLRWIVGLYGGAGARGKSFRDLVRRSIQMKVSLFGCKLAFTNVETPLEWASRQCGPLRKIR